MLAGFASLSQTLTLKGGEKGDEHRKERLVIGEESSLFGKKGKHWDYLFRDLEEWQVTYALFMSGGYPMSAEELNYTVLLWVPTKPQ